MINFKNLPESLYTGISVSLVFLSLGLTLALIRGTDVSLAVANTKLEVSQKITATIDTANQLEQTAYQLQQQQKQYQELKDKYDRLLADTNGEALKRLKPAIEEIQPTEITPTIEELKQQQEDLRGLIGSKE